jgi:ABC-2 type transport system ATP-binding protein
MSSASIVVSGLRKAFHFPVKSKDSGWLKNLLNPERREVVAVDNLSFSVQQGERLAFIGPNGAGKSTTIKMLSGILYPTAGEISVLGFNPARDRKALASHIGSVFGQRSQLLPNLPLQDSFELFGVMFGLSDNDIRTRSRELVGRFSLGSFYDQPVRKLSLGQRMRAEVALALIHRPQIVFLDEPTIGLDVVAKRALRELLLDLNQQEGTTIFLTSHDVGDIESLCERTIIVNYGRIVGDMPTSELARNFVSEKFIKLILRSKLATLPTLPLGLSYVSEEQGQLVVGLNLKLLGVQESLRSLIELFDVEDIDVYHADLETVIRHIYEGNAVNS